MKALLAFSLCFMTCANGTPPPRAVINTDKGLVIWYPDRHEGWRAASITKIHGTDRLEVFIAPGHCYQYAATTGISYSGNFMVDMRTYEISATPIINVALNPGWRTPFSIYKYPLIEFDAYVEPKGAGEQPAIVQVRSNGANYLITIMTLRPVSMGVTVPSIARLEPR